MAYKALYRKYRPTLFKNVVGQKPVITILKNAVIKDRISHAYVFSGLRGIGKTTIARIFAKAVNCLNPIDGEPCDQCANCLSVINNETTDVVELDAASNNGVDQMRDILEKVKFLPSMLKKKVYIIDEAHMLSTAAFNALLKTLEEPPAHIIFILATTEPYKIPATILSRCQRLDFKQLTVNEIVEMLESVVQEEDISITNEALRGIAEASEGGMRDALSILDQARGYNFNQITLEDVNNITGRVSQEYLIETIKALNEKDTQKALDNINLLIESGKEVSRIITCLIQFCRDLLLYKSLKDITSITYMHKKEEFMELAERTSEKRLFYYVDSLADVQNKIKYTNSQKIYLEVGIIKMINNAADDLNIGMRIEQLEEKIRLLNPNDNMDSINGVFSRLDTMENKIKKVANDLEKNNVQGLKDEVNSKIAMLEDMTLANKAIPNQLEEKIQDLEEKIIELRVNLTVDNSTKEQSDVTSDVTSEENNNISVVSNNDKLNELESKIVEIENKISANQNSQIGVSNYAGVNSSYEKLKELETKINEIETTLFNNQSTVQPNIMDEVQSRIEELRNELMFNRQNQLFDQNSVNDNLDYAVQIESIRKEFNDKLANISVSSTQQPTNLQDINSRVDAVEEYLEMVIAAVDDLSKTVKSSELDTTNSASLNNEISQLSENYFVLLNLVKNMQQNNPNAVNNEFIMEDSEGNEELKVELTNQLNEAVLALENKLTDNYNQMNQIIEEIQTKIQDNLNLIVDNKQELTQKIEEIGNIEMPEIVDYSPLINSNTETINYVKEYSINLSAKIQEIQAKVNEITTKLNGGITKRKSPFEIEPHDEEQQEEQVIVKEEEIKQEVIENKGPIETPVSAPKQALDTPTNTKIIDDENKQVISNDHGVLIRTKQVENDNKQSESSNVYDIKIVERILNQSFNQRCRDERQLIVEKWKTISSANLPMILMHTASILADATISANGFNELLLTLPHASLCNAIMEPRGHMNALQVIKIVIGKDYNFIALPENTWQEKRAEYRAQYYNNIPYPKLTPINNPELKINVVNTANLFSKKNKPFHEAESFFGADIVEREED